MSIDTGTHHLGTHGWLRLVLAALLVLVSILTLAPTPTATATSSGCQVRNSDTGRTFPRLQQAVDAAKPGAHLVVRGVCHGGTFINKDLVVKGPRTRHTRAAVLDADHKARVLTIAPSVKVDLHSLIVKSGTPTRTPIGGGISNKGELKLRDVVIRRNWARLGRGGGIYNEGSLRMLGACRVVGNYAADGAAVYNAGSLTMNDSSSIHGNLISLSGSVVNAGDVDDERLQQHPRQHRRWRPAVLCGCRRRGPQQRLVDDERLQQHPSQQGHGFRGGLGRRLSDLPGIPPTRGGGVYNEGTLTMTGSSGIHHNVAVPALNGSEGQGGGVYNASGGSRVGVNCGINVYGNTPDDCYIEP